MNQDQICVVAANGVSLWLCMVSLLPLAGPTALMASTGYVEVSPFGPLPDLTDALAAYSRFVGRDLTSAGG